MQLVFAAVQHILPVVHIGRLVADGFSRSARFAHATQ